MVIVVVVVGTTTAPATTGGLGSRLLLLELLVGRLDVSIVDVMLLPGGGGTAMDVLFVLGIVVAVVILGWVGMDVVLGAATDMVVINTDVEFCNNAGRLLLLCKDINLVN